MVRAGAASATPLAYRPEIDGLRAVAVVPVVLFHAGAPGFAGGFLGVDIFFVISGYLITSILAGQAAAGGIRFGDFFERRVRRIVPALLPVLAATALAAWWTMVPEDFRRFSQALAASALFGSNMLFAQKASYFSSPEGFAPLLHTWSLSVEEQFYLLYPVLLALAYRRGRTGARAIMAVACAVSLAAAFALQPVAPSWAFYLLPTRLWELLAGGCLALLPAPRKAHWLALPGVAAIALGFVFAHPESAVPGPVILLPVAGTLLVLRWGTAGTAIARVLSWRPLVVGGLVSYSLYLWHVPLLVFVQYHFREPAPAGWRAGAVVAALGLALLSWRLIERPVHSGAVLANRRGLLAVSLCALVLLAVTGMAGHFEQVRPRAAAEADALGSEYAGAELPDDIVPTGELAFVLYGDSHAQQYYRALSNRFGRGAMLTGPGCLSLPQASNAGQLEAESGCEDNIDQLRVLIAQRRPPIVFWAQRWERDLWDRRSGNPIGATTQGIGAAAFLEGLEQVRRDLPRRTRLVLIGNSPTAWAAGPALSRGFVRCRRYVDAECPSAYPATRAEGGGMNRTLALFAERQSQVTYVHVAGAICADDRCPILEGERLLYSDGSHFTALGAGKVADAVAARVKPEPDMAPGLPWTALPPSRTPIPPNRSR